MTESLTFVPMLECPFCRDHAKRTDRVHMRHTCSGMGEPFSRTSSLCSSAILMQKARGYTQCPSGRLGGFISIALECIRLQHFLHIYVHVGTAKINDNILCLHSDMLAYTCPSTLSVHSTALSGHTKVTIQSIKFCNASARHVCSAPLSSTRFRILVSCICCTLCISHLFQALVPLQDVPKHSIRQKGTHHDHQEQSECLQDQAQGVHMSWWMTLWGLGPIMKWVCRSWVGPDSYEVKQLWWSLHPYIRFLQHIAQA